MSGNVSPGVLMSKAVRACSSARTLLDLGDLDGACNRAYYAMFDAARAALLVAASSKLLDAAKTHSGVISAFGLHLVKNEGIDKEFGRMLKRAEETRIVADYTGDSIEMADAQALVEQSTLFVTAMRSRFVPELDSRTGN